MINSDALEAALLAKMVGTELKDIDNKTVDGSNRANRIDVGSFLQSTSKGVAHVPPPPVPHPSQQLVQSSPQQPIQPQPQQSANLTVEHASELMEHIKSIRYTLEKTNANLSKLTAQFGKIFHNLSKQHNE